MNNDKTNQDGEFCTLDEVYAVICGLTPGDMRVINTTNLQVHSTWRLYTEARSVATDLNNRINRERNKASKTK